MLQAHGLTYIADPRVGPLFENLSLSLLSGEKVALMGRNGSGKTKLIQILAGELPPSAGQVVLSRGSTVGYLPQDFDFEFDGSLRDRVGNAPAILRRLAKFGLLSRLDQPYDTLSFGERMRAALAQLLAEEPDLLLLDEPTNHLDLEARRWLEDFLSECRQGVLMVCHDRAMVNAVVSRVLELEQNQLREYAGGYDEMQRLKKERFEREYDAWEKDRAETRRLKNVAEQFFQNAARMTKRPTTRTFIAGAKPFYAAKERKIDKRAKAVRSRMDQLAQHATAKPFVAEESALEFRLRPLRSDYPLEVRHLALAYDHELFGGLGLSLAKGRRLALIGPNGSGKTTLMRILLGEIVPDRGEIVWSNDADVRYLTQSRTALDPSLPILAALDPQNGNEERFVRTLLGRLQLRGDAVDKPVGVLSVGERTKVEIVKMLMSPANVLLLDEPTNHLDVDSLEALEGALLDFPGCVIFTSHDRRFVEKIADETLELGAAG